MALRLGSIAGAAAATLLVTGFPALAGGPDTAKPIVLAQYYGDQHPYPIGPAEAHRLADQARSEGRWATFHYWQEYAAGLEGRPGPVVGPPPYGPPPGPPPYRAVDEHPDRIGPDQAYALEQQARRAGHWDEARYWADYRRGLDGR